MTIIAYRAGCLAADSHVTGSGTITGASVKIARNRKGDLAGATGDAVYGYAFRQWFLKGDKETTHANANLFAEHAVFLLRR